MDELQKFIQLNRQAIDADEPGEHVWFGIEREFVEVKANVVPLWFRQVAAACLIVFAVVALYLLVNIGRVPVVSTAKFRSQPLKDSLVIAKASPSVIAARVQQQRVSSKGNKSLAEASKRVGVANRDHRQTKDPVIQAFTTMESGYAAMVKLQLNRVKTTAIYGEDAGYFHLFTKQFRDLDNDEQMVKQQIKELGPTVDLVDQIISVYQQKITLLRQLQFEINKMNNRAKNVYSGDKLSPGTFISL